MAEKRKPAAADDDLPVGVVEPEPDVDPEPEIDEDLQWDPDEPGTETDEGHVGSEPLTPAQPAAETPKAPIAVLFDKIGITAGTFIAGLRLEGGIRLDNVRVEGVMACLEPFELIVIVNEDGITRGGRHVIRWSKVISLTMA